MIDQFMRMISNRSLLTKIILILLVLFLGLADIAILVMKFSWLKKNIQVDSINFTVIKTLIWYNLKQLTAQKYLYTFPNKINKNIHKFEIAFCHYYFNGLVSSESVFFKGIKWGGLLTWANSHCASLFTYRIHLRLWRPAELWNQTSVIFEIISGILIFLLSFFSI
jgi:hypothetical protein